MSNLIDQFNTEYKPKVAIIVFQEGQDYGSNYYLESHTINESGQLMEGKPLAQETIEDMVNVFHKNRQSVVKVTGMIPENLLHFEFLSGGNYNMTWYRPAEVKVLHHAAALKIPTAEAWVPAMLYKTNGKNLSVYALGTNKRPVENTKLFYAPYFNVSDGGVCLGNAKVKKPAKWTYEAMMKYWEDLFWLSEFTHVNGKERVKSGDLTAVWTRLIKSKKKLKWSDIKELVPYKKLSQIL